MKIIAAIRSRWRINNFTICLMGALLGLGLSLFLLRGFLFSPGLVKYYDLMWAYSSNLYPMHYLWNESMQAPVIANQMLGYLGFYQFPAEAAQRLILLLTFTVMGFSMFFATFKLTASRHATAKVPLIASTLATVFFVVNPLVCARVQHTFPLMWWYALLPLLVYFAYTGFRDIGSREDAGALAVFKKSIPIALILALMSISPRMPYFFPFLLLAFFAGFSRPWWDYLKKSALLMVFTMALYLVLSAVWLIPLILGSGSSPPGYMMTPSQVISSSESCTYFNIFTLSAWNTLWPDGSGVFRNTDLQGIWKVAIVAVPVFAFAALLFRRSKLIIGLVIFALIFVFLSRGSNPPFDGFYMWFTFDAPIISYFGWQFRHPDLFLVPLSFCYAMLIGLTISHFLGWVRDKLKRKRFTAAPFIIAIGIFLAVPLIAGYPLLSGDLNWAIKPRELTPSWVEFNDWMEEEGSDSKIVFYTSAQWWGSPNPSPTSLYRFSRPSMGELFLLQRALIDLKQSKPDTTRYGEIMSAWNARYLTVAQNRHDYEEVSAAAAAQSDLQFVQQFGSEHIYECQGDISQIEACAQSVAVLGGVENILSLTHVDDYDLVDSSVVFLNDQLSSCAYLASADILVFNLEGLDLYMTQLEDSALIEPFAMAGEWALGTAADIYPTAWHFYMFSAGMEMENWQYYYEKGLVWHWSAGVKTEEMPFKAGESGSYDIFVRYFQNEHGGNLRVLLDGAHIGDISTDSQVNRFVWQELGTVSLEEGGHSLTLENLNGFNGINLLAVLPHGEMERYREQVNELMAGKRIVHLWEAENGFNKSGEDISRDYVLEASKGEVLTLPPGTTAWWDAEILRGGGYRMAVGLNGSAVVSIDGQEFAVGTDELGLVYLDPPHLSKGVHRIEITPADGELELDVVWLYSLSSEGEVVEDIFEAGEDAPQLIGFEKFNPTKYRATVNASQPFMLAFAEAYSPLWIARVNGVEYPSVLLNGMVNGFWIEDEGELEITIEYKPQRWLYYGATISIVALVALLGFCIWDWRRRRWRRKTLAG